MSQHDGSQHDGNAPEDVDVDLLPEEYRSPFDRLSILLAVGVLVVAAFTAGALLQREVGGDDRTGSGGFAAGGGRSAQPGAGFPGTGGSATGGTGSRSGGTASGTSSGTVPVAVGTVVSASGHTLRIRNLAGRTVAVEVPEGTAVTVATAADLSSLTAGQLVTVTGATAADGTVTASGITARPTR